MKIRPIGNKIYGKVRPKDNKHGILHLPENRIMDEQEKEEMLEVDVLAVGPKVQSVKVGMCILVTHLAEKKFWREGDEMVFPEDYVKNPSDVREVFKGYRGLILCEWLG